MENKRFPQYLNAPLTIMWFEADEVNVIILCLTLAFLFGGWLWLSVIVFPWLYRKQKRAYPRGFLKHMLYFAGFTRMQNYPSYFDNEFYE